MAATTLFVAAFLLCSTRLAGQTYRRVQSLGELTSGAADCLIVSPLKAGGTAVMTSTLEKNKLTSATLSQDTPESVTSSQTGWVWTLTPQGECRFTLRSKSLGTWLDAKRADATDLRLTDGAVTWTLTATDGGFVLTQGGDRQLGLYRAATFGYYKPTSCEAKHLLIYRQTDTGGSEGGSEGDSGQGSHEGSDQGSDSGGTDSDSSSTGSGQGGEGSGGAEGEQGTATPPDSLLTGNGLKRLFGTWTSARLAQVDWTDVSVLDLSQISLPADAVGFASRPAQGNTLVVVSLGDAGRVPPSWAPFATHDAGTYTLATTWQLRDRAPLRLPLHLVTLSGQLSYQRQAYTDGQWETLCLPFTGPVPANFQAEVLNEDASQGDTLVFIPTEIIPRAQACIIRYTGSSVAPRVPFEVYCDTGDTLPLRPEQNYQQFVGSWTGLTLTADQAEHTWLLSPDESGNTGGAFVRAESGNKLPAFRASLQRRHAQGAPRKILHSSRP